MVYLSRIAAIFFLIVLPCAAHAQGDSIGTIRVKKKQSPPGRDTAEFTYDVYAVVEQMPDWPHDLTGMTLWKFIESNFNVPQEAFARGISGTVYVSFIIDADGAVREAKVERGVPGCQACDEEAVRVIKLMPRWNPGFQNGRPVAVRYSIPIKFRFNDRN